MQRFTHQDIQDQIEESLESITVATIRGHSKSEDEIDLRYNMYTYSFSLSGYDFSFYDAKHALEWYEENIDKEYSIVIKEL